jgi:hypothetical protein
MRQQTDTGEQFSRGNACASRGATGCLKPNKAHLSTGSSRASWGKAYGFRLLVYASGEGGLAGLSIEPPE